MTRSIEHSVIDGFLRAPPSKSMMQRAVAAALLCRNRVTIRNPSFCSDGQAALRVAEDLGAEIRRDRDSVAIGRSWKPAGAVLHCGESGLCMRMFAPIAALRDREFILTGDGSLRSRPVGMVVEPLRELGCHAEARNGLPPIRVRGPLRGGEVHVDGSVSSQFLTGLLIALPTADGDSRIFVRSLASRPYVDMTLRLLAEFHVTVSHERHEIFSVPGRQHFASSGYRVEGDWSGASFMMVAAALGGRVRISGLDGQSPQADRKILEALRDSGAGIRQTPDFIEIEKGERRSFQFDAGDCPDLFPPLVALACGCEGISRITGVDRLRFKESDRAAALAKEFAALGAAIEIDGNEMAVKGGRIVGGTVSSHGDHRIAMAAAAAAVASQQAVFIENSEAVAKSYPSFFEELASIGGRVNEQFR